MLRQFTLAVFYSNGVTSYSPGLRAKLATLGMGPLIFYPEGVASHFIRESMQWRGGPDTAGGPDLPKWAGLFDVGNDG